MKNDPTLYDSFGRPRAILLEADDDGKPCDILLAKDERGLVVASIKFATHSYSCGATLLDETGKIIVTVTTIDDSIVLVDRDGNLMWPNVAAQIGEGADHGP